MINETKENKMSLNEAEAIKERLDARMDQDAKKNLIKHRSDIFYKDLLNVSCRILSAIIYNNGIPEDDGSETVEYAIDLSLDLLRECSKKRKDFLIVEEENEVAND